VSEAVAAPALLETERLRLRRLEARDLPAMLAYRNDPEVARYQGWERFTASEAEAMLAQQSTLEPGTPGGWFHWMLDEKTDGALIGDVVLCVAGEDARQAELGFTLAREHQGRGYAGEGVRAVLGWAFGELGLHRVVAVTDARNAAAAALLRRLGFRREAHFIQNVWYKGAWGDEFMFAMLRSEWEESR
jgi:RimJ/RimL family protein N-acetyltransferase